MPARAVSPDAPAARPVPSPWVALGGDSGADVALVCFHCAGGSAQSFAPWCRSLAGRADLVVAELPGRGRRTGEPFAASLTDAARDLAEAHRWLPDKAADKRLVFLGHSLGALLAFETARALQRLGVPGPERLIVSARHAPDWVPASAGLPEPSDEALQRYLRDLDGTPPVVFEHADLLRMVVATLRRDLDLIRGYRCAPAPRLPIPLEVIGAIGDGVVPFESLLGWRAMTDGPSRIHMIPGGHFALLARPQAVLDILSRRTAVHSAVQ
ncbi:MAG TPA: alpha/beta fold hydrolase [Azospirillum sp.]